MRRIASFAAWTLFLAMGLSLVVVAPAAAYLDPGSGSLIFQVVVGASMAIALSAKVFWRRITAFFRRSK